MAKQSIRSIRKGSVQWNEEDRLQMVSMLAKAGNKQVVNTIDTKTSCKNGSLPEIRIHICGA